MKIVADENIPFVAEAFQSLGEVVTRPGRQLVPADLADADILLVRSVTKVAEKLLTGSSVKFVATATIGTDHIDLEFLRHRQIGFSSAAGSNANSVAEYVVAALLHHASREKIPLSGKILGVVGVGNIGTKIVTYAEKLGLHVLQNDPPRARETGDPRFLPLDDLMHADFITLHVPLTRDGSDPTLHLFDLPRLRKMKPGGVLINSSRGPVVETAAARKILKTGHLNAMLLDVWENEPNIDINLLKLVELGSPHIAGYSFDGKVNGTQMIYQAACTYFQQPATWDPQTVLPPPESPELVLNARGKSDEEILNEAVRKAYSITADDAQLRQIISLSPEERGAFFDQLRKNYPRRREFFNYRILLQHATNALAEKLIWLGFQVILDSLKCRATLRPEKRISF
jgi:erythronate-4-phosphate dehydrogenase